MEWIPALGVVVTVVSAFVALLNAQRAKDQADRAVAVEQRRQHRRDVLYEAMDEGERLLLRASGLSEADLDPLVKAFHERGHKAVEDADRAQLNRYNKALTASTVKSQLRERIDRLQDIQDRL